MAGKLDCFGITDIGCKRAENQDQFLIAGLNKAMRVHQSSLDINDDEVLFGESQGVLLLVADGMGGAAGGERASRLAIEAVASYLLDTMPWFYSLDSEGDEEARTALDEAIHRCQEQIERDAKLHPGVQGMGTTITACYVTWPRGTIVHAGDSRCYLHRNNSTRQLTTDHTLAEQLGAVDLKNTRWAHTLWNVVGSQTGDVEPELHQIELQLGDTLLLCTDGLVRQIEHFELSTLLNGRRSAAQLCNDLVQLAKDRGGSDNITVVVARFLDNQELLAESDTAELHLDQSGSSVGGAATSDRTEAAVSP